MLLNCRFSWTFFPKIGFLYLVYLFLYIKKVFFYLSRHQSIIYDNTLRITQNLMLDGNPSCTYFNERKIQKISLLNLTEIKLLISCYIHFQRTDMTRPKWRKEFKYFERPFYYSTKKVTSNATQTGGESFTYLFYFIFFTLKDYLRTAFVPFYFTWKSVLLTYFILFYVKAWFTYICSFLFYVEECLRTCLICILHNTLICVNRRYVHGLFYCILRKRFFLVHLYFELCFC